MYYIQNSEGEYLYGWLSHNPIWTNEKKSAKRFTSQDDAAYDEARLERAKILFWVILA